MKHWISLVVATKDRPDDLRTHLESLRRQMVSPDEIVVVDSSQEPINLVFSEFPELTIRYIRHWPPSAAAQRNAGVRACSPEATLIGFADDDTTFEPCAFLNMLDFWKTASSEVLGAAFNIRNYPDRGRDILKRSLLVERIGLYSRLPGRVSPSGWQTVIGELSHNQFVDWLPSGASLFRRDVFDGNDFDEVFKSYSYLEDLDFSFAVSRKGLLVVVANAGFFHFPSTAGRVSTRQFGRFEVRNRLYFVRKHKLSVARCYLGLFVRFTMSICGAVVRRDLKLLDRALGNLEEISRQCAAPLKKLAGEPMRRRGAT